MAEKKLPPPKNIISRPFGIKDLQYIEKICAERRSQTVLFKAWTAITTRNHVIKERVVVVTTYRVMVIKYGLGGKEVRQDYSLLDLEEYRIDVTEPWIIHLCFKDEKEEGKILTIETPEIRDLARAVYVASTMMFMSRPKELRPKVYVGTDILDGVTCQEASSLDLFLLDYLSALDYAEKETNAGCIAKIIELFIQKAHTFMFHWNKDGRVQQKKVTKSDIFAMCNALQFCNQFSEIHIDVPVENEQVPELVHLISRNVHIKKIYLTGTKISKGFEDIALAFQDCKSKFEVISISGNLSLGGHAEALFTSFAHLAKVPHKLVLSNNSLGPVGIGALMETLVSVPDWLNKMTYLDLSQNNLGKKGSLELTKYLDKTLGLRTLKLSETNLDVLMVSKGLVSNKYFSSKQSTLDTLDFSHVKFGHKEATALGEFLYGVGNLRHLSFAHCQMGLRRFTAIMSSLVENPNNLKTSLDFTGSGCGKQEAQKFKSLLESKKSNNISGLKFNDNKLTQSSIIAICKAAKNLPMLTNLELAGNLHSKINSVTKAMDALGELVNSCPNIRNLDVSNCGLRTADVVSLLMKLKNNVSLHSLNLSANHKIGKDGYKHIVDFIKQNKGVTCFRFDLLKPSSGNIKMLPAAFEENKTLTDIESIPFLDVQHALSGKERNEVKMALAKVIESNRADLPEAKTLDLDEAEKHVHRKLTVMHKLPRTDSNSKSNSMGHRLPLAREQSGSRSGSKGAPPRMPLDRKASGPKKGVQLVPHKKKAPPPSNRKKAPPPSSRQKAPPPRR